MDKWNIYYQHRTKEMGPIPYGDTFTYGKGYEFLKTCKKIEDWGCGLGGFKYFIKSEDSIDYVGIDGSITPWSVVKADLLHYKSETEGIFMRHIIEHNYEWETLLRNAFQSFSKKMCLILFTPFTEKTTQIAYESNVIHGVHVPDISFSRDDLIKLIEQYGITYRLETYAPSGTQYGVEHIFYLEK
jgi:hypothetical protein